ncbi:hypothetical protein L618_000400002430 [Rhodococcus rhodochrous J45]|uniref:Uncharacterized protein n=1 Tax=Rhodococcus rhodochrous J45 TaxID=935266 RepID=A0A562DM71_RHORH|nr:hypothetical protein [Rhodococcus rhodochrous]TWH10762.1 hypothetical protein L618_000400002430 [Rhodococcus rhodochrous J45]
MTRLRRVEVRLVGIVGAFLLAVATSVLAVPGVASAEVVTVPFRIDPASYGNPNGSFDVPPVRCAVRIGETEGSVTITGNKPEGWGCLIYARVDWLNLTTGASGTARMSDGLNGFPPEAVLTTGSGQVALVLHPLPGPPMTPGFTTFFVP